MDAQNLYYRRMSPGEQILDRLGQIHANSEAIALNKMASALGTSAWAIKQAAQSGMKEYEKKWVKE